MKVNVNRQDGHGGQEHGDRNTGGQVHRGTGTQGGGYITWV